MESRQSDAWEETAQRFGGDPVLADFVRPFPNTFRGKQTELGASFKRIAEALGKSKRTGAIQFTIQDGRSTRSWCLNMTPSGCDVSESRVESPDLEILTDAELWTEIARGDVAPLEAFGQGRVRVRGDVELARVLAKRMRR
jgi:putative sterol carrier protein